MGPPTPPRGGRATHLSLPRVQVRNLTLLPLNTAVLCAKELGRGDRTIKFLTALNQEQPRLWELQAEQEQVREEFGANAFDPLVEEELEAEEEWEAPLQAELLHTHVRYEETPEEQEVVKTYRLDRVPPALEKQLSDYKDWRLCPLNYQRPGNAVVDVTADNDCSTVLRFLFFTKETYDLEPSLDVFGLARLAEMAQKWLETMIERGLMCTRQNTHTRALSHARLARRFDNGQLYEFVV